MVKVDFNTSDFGEFSKTDIKTTLVGRIATCKECCSERVIVSRSDDPQGTVWAVSCGAPGCTHNIAGLDLPTVANHWNEELAERVASREAGTIWGDPDEYREFAEEFDYLMARVTEKTLESLHYKARYRRKHGFGRAWPIFDAVEDLVNWVRFGYGPEDLPTKRKIRALRIIRNRVDRLS